MSILTTLLFTATLAGSQTFDLVIMDGEVHDGSLSGPKRVDVGIIDDRIAALGNLGEAQARQTIDATGLVVAPGFINTLSWATVSLILDGDSQSNIRQGVTTEIFGEGTSMGPLNDELHQVLIDRQGDVKYEVTWRSLAQYLNHLEKLGVAPNVASFVGATTVRAHVLGYDDVQPSPSQLQEMQALVATAMREGALGLGSSLIYAPGSYARTEELVALAQVVGKYGGMYISHLRSEGDRLLEALDELITIAEQGNGAAEIYHLKVSGRENWHKYPQVIDKIEQARARGLHISANMYTYTAGSTGLDAAMPTWAQAGGFAAWAARLKDPLQRAKIAREMLKPGDWENLLLQAGAESALLVGFKNPELRPYIGKTLAEVAELRDKPAHEVAMDLVVEDGSRVQVIYFLMSEENVRKKIKLPWMTFGSDAASLAAAGHFLNQGTHPRAYGNFARVLAKYVREEGLISLNEAVHRLSGLPAERMKLKRRGKLMPGYFADIAIFEPDKIQDHATFAQPHQYATGMVHVLVNGELVLHHGEHTGARPGRALYGPGYKQP